MSQIDEGSDFALEINFADLWFDINANHTRPRRRRACHTGPDAFGLAMGQPRSCHPCSGGGLTRPDAAWLSAYTHLLQGVGDLVLAYDPTEPITRISAAHDKIVSLGGAAPSFLGTGSSGMDEIDLLAIVIAALQQAPDTARMPSAQQHFLAMIADKPAFLGQSGIGKRQCRRMVCRMINSNPRLA